MLVFIDTETSGLDPFRHGILSIGAVASTGDEYYAEFSLPGDVEYEDSALKVNGFDAEDIYNEDMPTAEDGALNFIKWLAQFSDVQLAGWNVSFDRMFLENHMFVTSRPRINYHWLDVMSLASILTNKTFLKLSDACDILGVEAEPEVHNALEGAKACHGVYSAIRGLDGVKMVRASLDEEGKVVW